MPSASFQKLSHCKISNEVTLYPYVLFPIIRYRYFNSITVGLQGAYVSGYSVSDGYYRWAAGALYQGSNVSGILYSSSDNVNFTARISGLASASANPNNNFGPYNHTGLTTGTSYYYYVKSLRNVGGVTYETIGPTVTVKTREPMQATGGNYTMKWWNRHGQWKMHVYRDSANFVTTTVPRGEKVWAFCLGGGGSGGMSRGGGGGGGGVTFIPIFNYSGTSLSNNYVIDDLFSSDWGAPSSAFGGEASNWGGINVSSNTTYSITVGAGGGEVNGGGAAQGNNGGNSIAFGFTGRGGGGGGAYAVDARSGGCGGGGGAGFSAYYTGGKVFSGHYISGYNYGFVSNDWNAFETVASYASAGPLGNAEQGFPGAAGTGNYGGGGGGLGGNTNNTSTSIDGKAGYLATNPNYRFVATGLSGTTTRWGAGGGGGGYSSGNGGANIDNGAGDGSAAWGQDYYAYPAGLGGAASWFGCGGGGGGKGGGGGGAGYKGLVIVAYCTGDPKNTTVGY